MERSRSTKAFLLSLLVLFAAPAAARASVSVSTSTTQAGAPATVTIGATFARDPTGRRVVLHLPAGLVGNPAAFARCSETQFQGDLCPGGSQVGTTSANGLGPLATGGIYNLVPHAGEPARLGITVNLLGLLPLAHNEASVSVRPDGGLDSTIARLSSPLAVSSLELVLDSSFTTLPTSCGRKTVTIDAAGASQSGSFDVGGCAAVPFSPSAHVGVADARRAVPSGYTVALDVPDGGNPRQSHVRKAVVTLPVGTTLSPGVANGLEACSAVRFSARACPAASQIGTVSFTTPLLGTLGGRVFLGDALRLLVSVDDPRVPLELTGDVDLDPATGQITTTFDNLPQVPFTSFSLTFHGGPRAVLANPSTCGTKTLAATLTPWSGTAARTATATFAVDAGCGAVPFRPTLALSEQSTLAGRPAGAATMTVTRPDLDQDISRVSLDLPPGLAGSVAGIPPCPEADANAGTCPAASRVGSATAVVGTGAAPVTLTGTAWLTGPFGGGLAGLAIAIPAKVGPVDLGTAVVRAGIILRPADGGLTVTTAPLPRMVGGVPVSIRRLSLRLDRPGFIRNASSCAPQLVRGTLTGSGGATATVQAPYQATDCAGLPFRPALAATVGARGRDDAQGKPPLRTVITVPAGDAATLSTSVHLPRSLGVDFKRAARLCTFAQLSAGACPPSARVGTATAVTPLLPQPLSGPVYLAQLSPAALPGLTLALRGPVSLRLDGAVDFLHSPVTTTFKGIPDVPLSRFELAFAGGRDGPLVVARNLCRGAVPRLTADFAGHNGKTAKVSVPMRVAGCGPAVSIRLRGLPRHPRLSLRVTRAPDAAPLRRVTLALPAKLRGVPARRGALRLTRRTLTLTAHGARTLTATIPPGALVARRGVGRHARLTFVVRAVATDGRRTTERLRIRGR